MSHKGEIVIPRFSSQDALAAMVRHVVSAIMDGTPLIIDGHLGRNVMRIIESCRRSLFEDAGQVLKETSVPASSVLMGVTKDAAGLAPVSTGGMNLTVRDAMTGESEAISQTVFAP